METIDDIYTFTVCHVDNWRYSQHS